MVEIHGTCERRFAGVRDALARSLAGNGVGACAAVFVDGEPVVDIWGGHADAGRTVPWERDTIANVWSTTKAMTALCALILADRGAIDLSAPVAAYWPEFAAAGKEGVLVRHVLSHTAGLPVWDRPLAVEDLYDTAAVTELLAAQAPRWEPGTVGCYHVLTQGFLIGEIVRRVTGRDIGAFFAEEVAGPLDADFHIGLSAAHDHRVAPVIAPQTSPAGRPGGRAAAPPGAEFANPVVRAEDGNTTAWRRAGIPSGGGHGNARSVAAVQSVLACGGTSGGVRLLSEAGCERAFEEQFRGVDRGLGYPIRYGMGYMLTGERTCTWGGWGGSAVMIDLENRMTVAYVMNRMVDLGRMGDDRALGVMLAAYDGLAA